MGGYNIGQTVWVIDRNSCDLICGKVDRIRQTIYEYNDEYNMYLVDGEWWREDDCYESRDEAVFKLEILINLRILDLQEKLENLT
jgi:hypothetical protein